MAQRHRIAISASRRTCFFHTFAAVHYTLELTLDKKKFLFVSLDGLIADIAWQVVKEGHEVKLFVEAQSEREIADGFVPKTEDWIREVPWTGEIGTTMFWSEPTRLFNATLKKMETRLREERYVGYIDVNCMVNSNGFYPLEFTSRFGYPTISIQQEGMLTPIGD